jgi:hypothetical protein
LHSTSPASTQGKSNASPTPPLNQQEQAVAQHLPCIGRHKFIENSMRQASCFVEMAPVLNFNDLNRTRLYTKRHGCYSSSNTLSTRRYVGRKFAAWAVGFFCIVLRLSRGCELLWMRNRGRVRESGPLCSTSPAAILVGGRAVRSEGACRGEHLA